jgi:uncharacterized protein
MPISAIPGAFALLALAVFAAALSPAASAPLLADARSAPVTAPNQSAYGIVGRVSDHAGVLAPDQARALETLLADYERETSHQLAVVIVPHLSGEDIAAFSLRTANAFGLGGRDADDGMLVTVAIRERKIRVELGRGFEPHIADEDVEKIIRTRIAPELAKGHFARGLEQGLQDLMQRGRSLVVSGRR